MNKLIKQKERGFTIIEVVLVLAIAALILLMVFLALPALQRGQRDTQRKDDISRLTSAVQNYQSGARGKLPSDWSTFVAQYMTKNGDGFADPSSTVDAYVLKGINTTSQYTSNNFEDTRDNIYYNLGGSCGDGQTPALNSGSPAGSAQSRKVVFIKPLEGGGIICQSN